MDANTENKVEQEEIKVRGGWWYSFTKEYSISSHH